MIATTSRPAPPATPADHPVLRALLSRPTPAVMGVLNVTPDSFSDGGQFVAPERALAQARRMIAEGADIIDIGAESTRPYGSQPVSAEEELKRLQPILSDVVSLGVPISIDSMKSAVVAWARAYPRQRPRRSSPGLGFQTEVASGPRIDHAQIEVGDPPSAHRRLPFRAGFARLFALGELVQHDRRLHVRDMLPGQDRLARERHDRFVGPTRTKLVVKQNYKSFAFD